MFLLKKEEYANLHYLEEKHWWHVGKRFLLFSLLEKYCPNKPNLNLLDVGCGTGLTTKTMEKFGETFGVDISKHAVYFSKKRGLDNIYKSGVERLGFKSNSFDIVTCLGILNQDKVKDDIKAMKELYRVIKPGGYLIITDPAMKCLAGKHDLMHCVVRRYSRKELKDKLASCGFTIEKITYFSTLFFPFVYIKRKLGMLLNSEIKSDVQETNPLLNHLLTVIQKKEMSMLKYLNFPFGVCILAVCRKN